MRGVIRKFLGIFFPPRCILCRKLLKDGEADLCGDCESVATYYSRRKSKPQFLDSFAAVWYYEDSVRSSLLRFKFYGVRAYADSYGRLLADRLREEPCGQYDLLVWVPVSHLRRLRRGYDQSELIARALSREMGLKRVCALKKIRHTRPQSGIKGFENRKANVQGAYRVSAPEKVAGKRILLVDDILTTGATMSEAARMLKSSGAKEVHGAAVAAKK